MNGRSARARQADETARKWYERQARLRAQREAAGVKWGLTGTPAGPHNSSDKAIGASAADNGPAPGHGGVTPCR